MGEYHKRKLVQIGEVGIQFPNIYTLYNFRVVRNWMIYHNVYTFELGGGKGP